MKKIKILSQFVCLAMLSIACHNDDEEEERGVQLRTVLVYIAGDNSLSAFAAEDLAEMTEGMQSVDDNSYNLLVYIDNGSSPKLIRLKKDKKKNVVQEVIATYEGRNSVDVSNMKEVINTAFSEYPAQSYGLVLWSHGDGWIYYQNPSTRWWGQDNESEDYRMNISDLREALSVAPHLDYILFDACYMQSVEVIYELRDCADYFVGSPTEIPGPGAPYDMVVPALFSQDKPENIAKNYYTVYAEKYNNGINMSNDNWTGGVSISVVKSSEVQALATATKSVLQTASSTKQSNNIDISDVLCYDPLRDRNYYDFMVFMERVQENEQAFENYKKAYQNAVIWKNTTAKNYCTYSNGVGKMVSMDKFKGLSTYILCGNNEEQDVYYRQSLQWYSAAGWDETGW